MADVHDLHDGAQIGATLQVVADQSSPSLADVLRHLGKAVPGQIDEAAIRHIEHVDQLRATRRLADARELLLSAQRVHRSAERRVGKECVSTCRSRWVPANEKKKNHNKTNIQTKQ